VKYGFRYLAGADWGRLRRLFRIGLVVKWGGGAVATLVALAIAPLADSIFSESGLTQPMLVAAFIPLAQAPEGIAGASMIVAGRYDLRGLFSGLGLVLRLIGLLAGAPHGVTGAVVGVLVAQILASSASGLAGYLLFRHHPFAEHLPLARDRPEIARFVIQSGIGTSLVSMRNTLAPLALGVVASSTQVGYFRAAQAPITGLEAFSAPVRLILLTEQTRDIEHGLVERTYSTLRRYVTGATLLALVIAPVFWIAMPWLIDLLLPKYEEATDAARILLLAACLRLVLGWTKSFPVSIGRPSLRIFAHGVEIVVLLPLLFLFGAAWGATGAAAAMLVATVAFGLTWAVLLIRLRREPLPAGEAPS
jgi:O-antigen/teichoic acid export membrane protein